MPILRLRHRYFHKSTGQTLIELIVSVSLIALLSALVLLYTRTGEFQTRLFREADRLVANLRRTQELALLIQEFQGAVPCGYGIHFEASATNYIVFADLGSGSSCSSQDFRRAASGSEDFETVKLEPGVYILSSTASDVVFLPPEPRTSFNPAANEATITLSLTSQPSLTRRVKVTKFGQITTTP